jgi:cellulose synthase/poly-beta-1,6-N-acetylglucosamine synthase-like glycosyltransferase
MVDILPEGLRMGGKLPVTVLVVGLTVLLSIPILILAVESWAAIWRGTAYLADLGEPQTSSPAHSPKRNPETSPRPTQSSLAVLLPAHNEAADLPQTLSTICPQLGVGDRLVVVADNCTDETADFARASGAEVVERHDPERRGKGYALDFGIQYLAAQPPDVVVLVDADCCVTPGSLAELAAQAARTQRPAQSINLLAPPAEATARDAISSLAFTLKNLVRPLGLHVLGQPCLVSMGIAIPWHQLQPLTLASGNLVEDMQMGLDLALNGTPAQFCPTAQVTGFLPQSNKAAQSQRTRWEQGHLQTLSQQVPRLLAAAWQQRRLDLLCLVLELSVPPLTILVLLWLMDLGLAGLGVGLGLADWQPLAVLVAMGALLLATVVGAWYQFCRSLIPARVLLSIPFYVFWKLPLYLRFLVKPQTQWVRTERDSASSSISDN